jgi:hypothetical protein
MFALVGNRGIGIIGLLNGHYIHPPLHNPVTFREKPVTSDIHSVAFIINSFGNTTDVTGFFEYNWFYIGPF